MDRVPPQPRFKIKINYRLPRDVGLERIGNRTVHIIIDSRDKCANLTDEIFRN